VVLQRLGEAFGPDLVLDPADLFAGHYETKQETKPWT
jgi:hypothetical protein